MSVVSTSLDKQSDQSEALHKHFSEKKKCNFRLGMIFTYNIDFNKVVAQWGFVITVPFQLLSINPKTQESESLSLAIKIKITQEDSKYLQTISNLLTFISFSLMSNAHHRNILCFMFCLVFSWLSNPHHRQDHREEIS